MVAEGFDVQKLGGAELARQFLTQSGRLGDREERGGTGFNGAIGGRGSGCHATVAIGRGQGEIADVGGRDAIVIQRRPARRFVHNAVAVDQRRFTDGRALHDGGENGVVDLHHARGRGGRRRTR